jgi:hypothetical protein
MQVSRASLPQHAVAVSDEDFLDVVAQRNAVTFAEPSVDAVRGSHRAAVGRVAGAGVARGEHGFEIEWEVGGRGCRGGEGAEEQERDYVREMHVGDVDLLVVVMEIGRGLYIRVVGDWCDT